MSRIAVIGTGYVGLTTGACLAHLGHDVVAVDIVPEKIALLNQGKIPIFETGLEDMVRQGLAAGRLKFRLGANGAVDEAEFVFLCLPTPQGVDGSADLSCVEAVAREIAPYLRAGAVVINKSTAPAGSVELVSDLLGRSDVAVVSNPEFLREGSSVHDWLHPDRIVIGGFESAAVQRTATLFAEIDAPLVLTDAASAETIKYASNAFLATKISFVNSIANLCEAIGADVDDVLRGMGYDHRIGFDYLQPGPGWGGSCLPKDTRALLRMAEDSGYDFGVLRGVIAANQAQQDGVVDKIERMVDGSLSGAVVAAWGLAFKAGTDDIRDSPAVAVINRLLDAGAAVQMFDPVVRWLDGVRTRPDPYSACAGADVLAVLTEWPLFSQLDLCRVKDLMTSPRIVDARNVLNASYASTLGFAYEGVGRRGWSELSELYTVDATGSSEQVSSA